MIKILIINGPNLNFLGLREVQIYGKATLPDIEDDLREYAKTFKDLEVEFIQSNNEGEIVDAIQNAFGEYEGIIINPAAYTHTSVAIHDAIRTVNIPTVEVHLTNPGAREDFRKTSFVSPVCIGTVAGFKGDSYKMALFGLYNYLYAKRK